MTVEWNATGDQLFINQELVARAWHEQKQEYCFQIMKTELTNSYLSKGHPSLINAKSALIKQLSTQLKHPVYPIQP
jgi:hypothetical protein